MSIIFKNCAFSELTSDAGGAIYIFNVLSTIELYQSSFIQCTATSTKNSTVRNRVPSGGGCYIDVKSFYINNIITKQCKSVGYGNSIYACTKDINSIIEADCISDSLSGNQINSSPNIVFELGRSTVRQINITMPFKISKEGSLHIGMRPQYNSNKFINVIMNETDSSTSVGLSTRDGYTNEASFFHIENSKPPSEYGILSFWEGNYKLDSFYLISCQGNFEDLYYEVQSITSENFYYDDNLITISFAICSISCINSETEHEFAFECFNDKFKDSISCIVKNSKTKIISLPLYSIFLYK